MNSPQPSGRCKNMMYVQQTKHLPTSFQDLLNCVSQKLQPEKFAAIIHDADVKDGKPVEPHVHVMMCFENARSINNVAKQLGDQPQSIEKWNGNRNNGFSYLVHATKDTAGKHQYPADKVIANFDFPAFLASVSAGVQNAKDKKEIRVSYLLDALYNGEITKGEVEAQLTGSEIAKYANKIDTVEKKRLQRLAENFRKDMIAQGRTIKTIWIYGRSGTGKTSFAKAYAEKLGRKYYISGSSRDLFQSYTGESIIILDEFRPGNLTFEDLLRITDPYGRDAFAPSRYYDKALAADTFIITSPYDPGWFYRATMEQRIENDCSIDKFDQLIRRLTVIIQMDDVAITAMEYNSCIMRFQPIPGTSQNNPYSALGRKATDKTANSIAFYNSIFEDATTTTANVDGSEEENIIEGNDEEETNHEECDDLHKQVNESEKE